MSFALIPADKRHATAFWRRVVPTPYKETVTEDEVRQEFESRS